MKLGKQKKSLYYSSNILKIPGFSKLYLVGVDMDSYHYIYNTMADL